MPRLSFQADLRVEISKSTDGIWRRLNICASGGTPFSRSMPKPAWWMVGVRQTQLSWTPTECLFSTASFWAEPTTCAALSIALWVVLVTLRTALNRLGASPWRAPRRNTLCQLSTRCAGRCFTTWVLSTAMRTTFLLPCTTPTRGSVCA